MCEGAKPSAETKRQATTRHSMGWGAGKREVKKKKEENNQTRQKQQNKHLNTHLLLSKKICKQSRRERKKRHHEVRHIRREEIATCSCLDMHRSFFGRFLVLLFSFLFSFSFRGSSLRATRVERRLARPDESTIDVKSFVSFSPRWIRRVAVQETKKKKNKQTNTSYFLSFYAGCFWDWRCWLHWR